MPPVRVNKLILIAAAMTVQVAVIACVVVLAGRPARDANGAGTLPGGTAEVNTARPRVDAFPGRPQTPLSGD